jgi:hypothetical protein
MASPIVTIEDWDHVLLFKRRWENKLDKVNEERRRAMAGPRAKRNGARV